MRSDYIKKNQEVNDKKGVRKLRSSQMVIIVSSVLEIIAVFLPAASIYGRSFNLIKPNGSFGPGIIFIIIAIFTILLTLLKKRVSVLILSILGVILALQQYVSINSVSNDVNIGIGMFLTIAYQVAVLVGAILLFINLGREK